MKFRKTKIFFIIFLLSACNLYTGLEESVIIYDPNKRALFISLLDEKDVDYRIKEDGQIFYPVTQKESVKEAFEKATGKKIPE